MDPHHGAHHPNQPQPHQPIYRPHPHPPPLIYPHPHQPPHPHQLQLQPHQYYPQNPNSSMYPPSDWYRPQPQLETSNDRVPETQFQPDEPVFSTQVGIETINLEEEEEEEESPISKKRNFWSVEEDTHLLQSWLNISKDPCVGNDQKASRFWERIEEQYNHFRRTGLTMRKWQPIKSRFFKLSKATQAFVGCYKEATKRQKSGYSEKDIMAEACAMYAQSAKEDFKFEHAWRILRDEPKWKGEAMPSESKRQKNSADGAYTSSSSNPSTPNDCSEYEHSQPSSRPIGQKKAKGKAKEAATTTSESWDLSKLEAGVARKNELLEDFVQLGVLQQIPMMSALIQQDTSEWSEEAKAQHQRMIAFVMSKIP